MTDNSAKYSGFFNSLNKISNSVLPTDTSHQQLKNIKIDGSIPSRSYCIVHVIVETLLSSLPISVERKRVLIEKLEDFQHPAVSGLLLTVVFLSIVVATVTYSTGIGFDFTLLFLIAGLWMLTTRYAATFANNSKTQISASFERCHLPSSINLKKLSSTYRTTAKQLFQSININYSNWSDKSFAQKPVSLESDQLQQWNASYGGQSYILEANVSKPLELASSGKIQSPALTASSVPLSLNSSSWTDSPLKSFNTHNNRYRSRLHTVETLFPISKSCESLGRSLPHSSRSDEITYKFVDNGHQRYDSDGENSFSDKLASSSVSSMGINVVKGLVLDDAEDEVTCSYLPVSFEKLNPVVTCSVDIPYNSYDSKFNPNCPMTSTSRSTYGCKDIISNESEANYEDLITSSSWGPPPKDNADSMLWLFSLPVIDDLERVDTENIRTSTTSLLKSEDNDLPLNSPLLNDHFLGNCLFDEDSVSLHPHNDTNFYKQTPLEFQQMTTMENEEVEHSEFIRDEELLLKNVLTPVNKMCNLNEIDQLHNLMDNITALVSPTMSTSDFSTLEKASYSALNSFVMRIDESCPIQLHSLFFLLAKYLRRMINDQIRIPESIDVVEFDPLNPDYGAVWTGDFIELRSLLENGNVLWSYINHVYSTLVSAQLVDPDQTWSHRSASKPDSRVRTLIDLNVLNEFMCGTMELLDVGLRALDKFMNPAETNGKAGNSATDTTLSCLVDDSSIWVDDELHRELNEIEQHQEKLSPSVVEEPIFHSCIHLDLKVATCALHQLQVLFFTVVEQPSPQNPLYSEMRKFLELLIRCYLLIGCNESVNILKEALATHLEAFSVGAVGRCLRTSTRSPAALEFWDAIEMVYTLPTESDTQYEIVRRLRNCLWPLSIDCRVQYKMYDAALQLLDTFCKSGGSMPQHFSSSIIQLGLECERIDLIHNEMGRGYPVNDIQKYMQIVRALGRNGDVSGALRVLEQAENDGLVKPDIPAYNSVLDVCVSNNDLSSAESLFNHMKALSMLDVVSFNIMIKGSTRVKPPDLSTACSLLHLMQSFEFSPDSVSYNSIISAAVSVDQMDLAWSLIDDMEERGIPVDCYTCSIMIKHLRPSSSPRNRRRTLELMEKINVCEDTVLFSTIVDACARLKDQRRLRQALERFHQSGLRPNVHAYGTLIKAYGRCRDVNRAWDLWREMTETRRLEPTNYTYGCMFDTLVSNGRVEDGIDLLNNSLRKGREANTVQYSILIKGCAQKKQVDQALQLYQDMQARNVPCNEVTYNTLINACTSAGDLKAAEMIMQNMRDAPNCKPDVISYSTLIKGFCSHGQTDRAFEIFHEMESNNIQADAIVFNTLLEGCSKRMEIEAAEEVFARMLERNVSPSSFTLTILIKLYGKVNNLPKALHLANELPKRYGFEADAYVYTSLIAACLTNGNIDSALQFFQQMNAGDTRSSVSGRTFGTIIIGCIKSSRYFTAYELLVDSHLRNLDVDPAVVSRLHQNFLSHQDDLIQISPISIMDFLQNSIHWLSEKAAKRYPGSPPRLSKSTIALLEGIEQGNSYEGYRFFPFASAGADVLDTFSSASQLQSDNNFERTASLTQVSPSRPRTQSIQQHSNSHHAHFGLQRYDLGECERPTTAGRSRKSFGLSCTSPSSHSNVSFSGSHHARPFVHSTPIQFPPPPPPNDELYPLPLQQDDQHHIKSHSYYLHNSSDHIHNIANNRVDGFGHQVPSGHFEYSISGTYAKSGFFTKRRHQSRQNHQ